MAECAECGHTSPLTRTRGGTPQGWAHVADTQITLCPLHRPRMPEGWQNIIQTYKRGELDGQRGDIKPPPPSGAFEDE